VSACSAPKEVQDPVSLYFIHPNENPSMILVTPALQDGNYHSWSTSMKMCIGMTNKNCFIDGTLKKPSLDDAVYPY
jgi:hypothetical protein